MALKTLRCPLCSQNAVDAKDLRGQVGCLKSSEKLLGTEKKTQNVTLVFSLCLQA